MAPKAGVARLEQLDRILGVPSGERLGLGDRGREALPADGAVDGGERVAPLGLGRDQLVAHPGEKTDGPPDRATIVAEGRQLASLGAPEHAADQAVVQVERRVGQPGAELEDHRHQDAAPAAGREIAQLAGREALGLTAEPEQVMPRDAHGALGLDADRADVVEPLHGGDESRGARRFRGPAEPSRATSSHPPASG